MNRFLCCQEGGLNIRIFAGKIIFTLFEIFIITAASAETRQWPDKVNEIQYESSVDSSMQPAMFYAPETNKPIPLLVLLHTWSSNYKEPNIVIAEWCIKKNWAFIVPNFRGPNWTHQAMGSDLVVQDIKDAVNYAKKRVKIDSEKIYLVGGSGGGYASLLMAGRSPEIWAAVSTWCPITDLKKWHQQCKRKRVDYYKNIEKVCMGVPGENTKADEECAKRSAATYLDNAKNLKIDISTGIHDGHTGSVPISHAFEAFNILANPEDRISEEDIRYFVENQSVPPSLKMEKEENIYNTKHKIHFRKTSKNVRITIFEGGHWILFNSALDWLEQQEKNSPPMWGIKAKPASKSLDEGTELGK